MHLNIFCLFLLIFLMTGVAVQGQSQVDLSYVITNRNDTIYGKIIDRKEGSFPHLYKSIRLKNGSLFTRKFSPKKIVAYSKGDEYFESVYISFNRGIFQQELFSMEGIGKKSFIKLVHKGKLSLYHLEFMDIESGFVDYVPYFRKGPEPVFVRASQGLLGLRKKALSAYFSDCPELVRLINEGEYKYPYKIAEFYNDHCGLKIP